MAAVLIMLLCSFCFADCITDWRDYPVNGNWRSYAVFASKWLTVDEICVKNIPSKNVQEINKYIHSTFEGQWDFAGNYGYEEFAGVVGRTRQKLCENNFIVIGSK